jgi:hypothetical protein
MPIEPFELNWKKETEWEGDGERETLRLFTAGYGLRNSLAGSSSQRRCKVPSVEHYSGSPIATLLWAVRHIEGPLRSNTSTICNCCTSLSFNLWHESWMSPLCIDNSVFNHFKWNREDETLFWRMIKSKMCCLVSWVWRCCLFNAPFCWFVVPSGAQNFDVIRLSTYRTACKLRFVQKRCNRKCVWSAMCLVSWHLLLTSSRQGNR